MEKETPKSVWEWLADKNYSYLPFWDGWMSEGGYYFFSQTQVYKNPGHIIHFLKTGAIRTTEIFQAGLMTPSNKTLGVYTHKDGTCVTMKRLK
jgi:hypothetical protein